MIVRGLKTVSTIRYSLILLMNKVEKPCVGVPEDEDNEFDECQQEHINHQVGAKVTGLIFSKRRDCQKEVSENKYFLETACLREI